MASIEDNFVDSTYTATPIPVTGNIVPLLPGLAGFGNSRVIGQAIECNSVQLNHLLQLASQASPPLADVVRTIVFVDTQANSSTPSVTDILASADINAHFNYDNVARFLFLWDATADLPVTAMTATACAQSIVQERIELDLRQLRRTTFQQGTMTVTTNDLYILIISATGQADLKGTTRLRYKML